MKIIVLSITHPLQLLEDPADTEGLQKSKAQLRAILEAQFAKESVGAIFEECSFTLLPRNQLLQNWRGRIIPRFLGITSA
jgi:hypothetical protein